MDDSLGPESEDDNDDESFLAITVVPGPALKPVARPTVATPSLEVQVTSLQPLVQAQPPPSSMPVTKTRNPNLVCRFTGPGKSAPVPLPVVMNQVGTPLQPVHCAQHPGPYTPRVQAMYRRGNGTFYSSHTDLPEAELSEDEFGTAVASAEYEQPQVYTYPNAHPDLENFPCLALATTHSNTTALAAMPVNNLVRKQPPATTASATTVVTKHVKIEGSGSQGRVRASDFDDLTKSLIKGAISIYKAQVGAVTPFPGCAEDRDTIKLGWMEVCREQNLRVELDKKVFKLITAHASQAHGQLKTISKPYIVQSYKIDGTKHDVRDKVENLLDGSRFIYKDPETKKGIFCADIIQTLINKMWFRHKNDEGVIHPEFSEDDMLALPTIVLVLTIAENNLDEWVTGEHTDVPFTAAAYKAKYRTHLNRLTKFAEKTKETEIIPRLRAHMLKMARKHARVEDAATASASNEISDTEIEAAKEEWANLVLSDEE